MADDELTDAEVGAFADRLQAFVPHLSSREEAFLLRMLRSLPQRDDVARRPVRTVHDLVIAIDQTYLSPDDTFPRNPQPLPPGFRLPGLRRGQKS